MKRITFYFLFSISKLENNNNGIKRITKYFTKQFLGLEFK